MKEEVEMPDHNKEFSIKTRVKDENVFINLNDIIEDTLPSENTEPIMTENSTNIQSELDSLKKELDSLKENLNKNSSIETKPIEEEIKPRRNILAWIFYLILGFGILYSANVLYDKYKTYSSIFEYLEKTHSLKYEDLLKHIDERKIPLNLNSDSLKNKISENMKERIKDLGFSSDSKEWKKVLEIKKYYTLMELHNGQIEKRSGGSHAWRINNPGRISFGRFSNSVGAIGRDENNLAIFPSLEKGRNALKTLLFEHNNFGFKDLTVFAALKRYSTLKDDNRSSEYANEIIKNSGVSKDKIMRTLNDNEKNKIIEIIEKVEEIKEGISKIYSNLEELKKE